MPRAKKAYNDKNLTKYVKQIGKNLRRIRESARFSQNALAKMSKVSLTTINEIENFDTTDARLSTLSALAQALNIDLADLLFPPGFDFVADNKKQFQKAVEILNKVNSAIGGDGNE